MKEKWLTLIIIACSILLFNVEYSGIPVIIPAVSKSLLLSVSQIQWMATGYLLAFFSLMITAGRLGDLYSQPRIFMIGLLVFVVGSALGGVAGNGWEILLARVIQGVGAAIVYPNMTAIAFVGTTPEQKSQIAGIIASIVGVTIAIGPPLAGFIATYLSWRSFFMLNVPIGLLLIFLIFRYLCRQPILLEQPKVEKTAKPAKKFDIVGAIVLVIILVALIYGLEQFKDGLSHWAIAVGLLLVALIAVIGFIKIEKRAKIPIIPLEIFSNRCLVVYCMVRWTSNFSFYVLFFILGLYLTIALGYSELQAGLIFLPMSLMVGIASPIGGKLVAEFGEVSIAVTGMVIFLLVFSIFSITAKYDKLEIDLILLTFAGIAYGLVSPALIAAVMSASPPEQSGLASGIFYMMSLFGSTVGVTITGIIFYNLHQATVKQTIEHCFPIVMIICFIVVLLGCVLLLSHLCFEKLRDK